MPPRLRIPFHRPFVCVECQTRQRDAFKIQKCGFARSFGSNAAATSSNKYLQLTNRTLIRLAGPDAAFFLHNIIPAKILDTGSTRPIYTAFLSAHGRILNDVFIYPPSKANAEEWFIEVDSNSAMDLMKHLRKHKLRSKFQMGKVDPEQKGIFFGWPGTVEDVEVDGRLNDTGRTGGKDPRPGMGTRWLDDSSGRPGFIKHLEASGISQATLDEYTVHRITNGFAEGQAEIISGSALPQESNIDFFGGIDFFKGCYLGQELTIRTHHTGVVRKRILPVQLYAADDKPQGAQLLPDYKPDLSLNLPPPESNISKVNARGRGRSSGKWLSGTGNIGLALCRLEMMTDIQLTADRTNYDPTEEYKVIWGAESQGQQEVMLRPFVPKWLKEGVEQSLRRKEKKAKVKPRDEEEDYDDVN